MFYYNIFRANNKIYFFNFIIYGIIFLVKRLISCLVYGALGYSVISIRLQFTVIN